MINFQPINKLTDLFSLCPGCQEPASGLCDVCRGFLPSIETACQRCALPIPSGEICGECMKHPPQWDGAIAPWTFDGLTRFLIHQFKYHYDRTAGNALCKEWIKATNQQRPTVNALIAVPMHHKKQAKKGINQTDLITKYFSDALKIPRFSGIKKIKETQALEGLTRKERQLELRNAFELTKTPPPSIAIIDDVLTTGATANTLAKLLKENGCKTVSVWTLARTPKT